MRDIENGRRLRREWYHRNREVEAEKTRQRKLIRFNKSKEYINQLKGTTPCTDCGKLYHPSQMDFDHLRDKLFTIAKHNGGRSLESLKAEIAKCEIVCANCHRLRTFNRRNVV